MEWKTDNGLTGIRGPDGTVIAIRKNEAGFLGMVWAVPGSDNPLATVGVLRDGDGSEDLVVTVVGTADNIRRLADVFEALPATDKTAGMAAFIRSACALLPPSGEE